MKVVQKNGVVIYTGNNNITNIKTSCNYVVWTKVSIPANGSTTLYIKKEPGYSPNGDEVFEFFDDFNGSDLDTNKWNIRKSYYTLQDGYIRLTSGYSPVISMNYNFTGGIIEAKVRVDNTVSTNSVCYEFSNDDFSSSYYVTRIMPYYSVDKFSIFTIPYSPITGGSYDYINGEWVIWKIKYTSDGFEYYINNILVFTCNLPLYHEIGLSSYSGSYGDFDWIRIRKYADLEPNVTVEQMSNSVNKVTITNNSSQDLVEYQVKIPVSVVDSVNDSLLVTDDSGTVYPYWIESTYLTNFGTIKDRYMMTTIGDSYTINNKRANVSYSSGTITVTNTDGYNTHTASISVPEKDKYIVVCSVGYGVYIEVYDKDGNFLADYYDYTDWLNIEGAESTNAIPIDGKVVHVSQDKLTQEILDLSSDVEEIVTYWTDIGNNEDKEIIYDVLNIGTNKLENRYNKTTNLGYEASKEIAKTMRNKEFSIR